MIMQQVKGGNQKAEKHSAAQLLNENDPHVHPSDPAARLDLQQVLHRIYDAAGYTYHIYSGKPEPPLTPEQAAWAQQLLQAAAQPA